MRYNVKGRRKIAYRVYLHRLYTDGLISNKVYSEYQNEEKIN